MDQHHNGRPACAEVRFRSVFIRVVVVLTSFSRDLHSLGVEPVDPLVMKQPPRPPTEEILSKRLLIRVFCSAAVVVAGTLFVFVREMSDGVVTARDTTMTFTTFIMYDMFNALACRSSSRSIVATGTVHTAVFSALNDLQSLS